MPRYALLLDDEPDIRMIVGIVLTELDYEVIAAGFVEEARELLSRGPIPNLAVLDYNLPGGKGPDIARLLRECFGQSIRIVSLSANMGPDARWDPEERKLYDVILAKPFELDELRSAFKNPDSP